MRSKPLILALLALTGCATVRPQPAQKWLPTLEEEEEHEYAAKPWTLPPGALASISALPPLQLEVFNQAMAPTGVANCSSPSAACTVAAITATTGTFSGAISGTTISGTTFSGSSYTATIASGSNAFGVGVSGARVDFGAGASDYASSDGTTVTFAGPVAVNTSLTIPASSHITATAASTYIESTVVDVYGTLDIYGVSAIITNSSGTSPVIIDDAQGMKFTLKSLATCAAALEGVVQADVLSGVATGKRTKLCLCTSDGASAYKWQNLATGTLGTTTTCGTE